MHHEGSSVDAVYFSCHKLLGGVGAPGVLVVRKDHIRRDRPPSRPGGGTVFFANKRGHRFLSNRVEREQGGTLDIVGACRAALCISVTRALSAKDELSPHWDRGSAIHRLMGMVKNPNNLVILGVDTVATSAVPILSFLVRSGPAYLHHNFVCQLLNDLFGIQTRGETSSVLRFSLVPRDKLARQRGLFSLFIVSDAVINLFILLYVLQHVIKSNRWLPVCGPICT